MFKYKANTMFSSGIEKVEIKKETTHQIVKSDSIREAKSCSYHTYFDTWKEAHTFLLTVAKQKLISARLRLQKEQGNHENIKGMKEPK